MPVLRQLLKFGDVLHQCVLVQALARQLVVPAMQGNGVIVDQPSNVKLLMQVLMLFRLVELELVRLDDLHFASSLTLAWRGGQQWLSCSRLSQHRYAATFLGLLAKCEAVYIVLPCQQCISLLAYFQIGEYSYATISKTRLRRFGELKSSRES